MKGSEAAKCLNATYQGGLNIQMQLPSQGQHEKN